MKALSNNRSNAAYLLALLDWGRILEPNEMDDFTDEVVPLPRQSKDGWVTKSLMLAGLNDIIMDIEMGFYHSRLIFRFNLKVAPKSIKNFREDRSEIKNKIEDYLKKNVIDAMKPYVEKGKKPRIFLYPIFEIQGCEAFWKSFGEQKPYSSATTCFYTELDDPRGREWWLRLPLIGCILGVLASVLHPKKVRMRVSGGSVITTEMSNWFFWNLTNIIFHEGLYRQSRPIGLSKVLFETKTEGVYYGLENRLEDFASRLMDTFHDLSSIRIRGIIAQIALIVAIFALLFTVIERLWEAVF